MLKLLLREDRHWYKTEYLFRFLVTLMVFGCFLLLILSIALGAQYVLVFVEKKIAEDQLQEINSSEITKERANFTKIAKRLNKKINYISLENYKPSFFITNIISSQPDGIGINSITYKTDSIVDGENKNPVQYVSLELKGVAINRTILVNFQKDLQAKNLYESVNIPFSSFTKETNIPFTINIKTVDLIQYFKQKEQENA